MTPQATLRILAAAALVAMGSCSTTPDTTPGMPMLDGATNHPITVEPSYRALKLGCGDVGVVRRLDQKDAKFAAHDSSSGMGRRETIFKS